MEGQTRGIQFNALHVMWVSLVQKINGFNMIKYTCLFPLAQSPTLGGLESLEAEQRLYITIIGNKQQMKNSTPKSSYQVNK
jgi:hypothetical protein